MKEHDLEKLNDEAKKEGYPFVIVPPEKKEKDDDRKKP